MGSADPLAAQDGAELTPAMIVLLASPARSGMQTWDTSYRVATAAGVPNRSPGPRTNERTERHRGRGVFLRKDPLKGTQPELIRAI